MATAAQPAITEHIDRLTGEGLLGMAELARLMGTFRCGKPCHPSTLIRWCLKGTSAAGRIVQLEYIRVGDRLMSSRAALLRFLAAQQTAADVSAVPTFRTPAQRAKASEAAARKLESLGV